ncbi:MAG: hypothetical protein ACLVJB_03570 [Christensenellales bacterium]
MPFRRIFRNDRAVGLRNADENPFIVGEDTLHRMALIEHITNCNVYLIDGSNVTIFDGVVQTMSGAAARLHRADDAGHGQNAVSLCENRRETHLTQACRS